MFTFKIGAVTTEVECPFLEDTLLRIETKLDLLTDVIIEPAKPQIKFIIGPVSEQPKEGGE